MPADSRAADQGPWRAEGANLARAIAGAFLFGMPLIFTMEMWWIGEHLGRTRLVAFVLLALVVNVALASYTGFRDRDGWRESIAEGIESIAIGVVAAVITLAALGQLSFDGSLEGMFGMVAIQAVPLSLGACVASIVFDGSEGRSLDDGDDDAPSPARELANDVLATFAGALFIGFAIAPTEEIPMLAAQLHGSVVLGATIALTMLISYLIVFASGFDPSHRADGRRATPGGYFQHPVSETVLAYVVAIAASFVLLLCFGQVDLSDPPLWITTQVVVLAVPASIGGAAGRIVL